MKLDELKIAYANASINLEIVQTQYNQIKAELVKALNEEGKNNGEKAKTPEPHPLVSEELTDK